MDEYRLMERINLISEAINNLQKEIEELQKKKDDLMKESKSKLEKPKRWRAKYNEEYYFVDSAGYICNEIETKTITDYKRYDMGNYFQTIDKAKKYKEKQLLEQKIKDIALKLNDNKEIDWNNHTQTKYHLIFNHKIGKIGLDNTHYIQQPEVIYCTNPKFVDEVLKEINEEDLIDLIKENKL